MASAYLREELNCSVCLNIYTDPVTLRCGHNFCRECIDRVLDTQERSGVYSCPECREECRERPNLMKNRKLGNIAEYFTSAQPRKDQAVCTYCIHAPVPATKSCLLCEASLCDRHLQVHNKSAEHVLIEPVLNFDRVKCLVHNKMFMYYCSEDAACLCAFCCLSPEHKSHDVKLLNESADNKKQTFQEILDKLGKNRKKMEKRIHCLQVPKSKLQEKANSLKDKVQTIFNTIRRKLSDLERRILNDLCTQEKEMTYNICDRIEQLELKKNELSKKMRRIEELCNMADPVTVLHEPDLYDTEKDDFEDKKSDDKTVQDLGDLDEDSISRTLHTGLSDIIISTKGGIHTDDEVDILLDINTAANNVHISNDLKLASWLANQRRPKTPQRFQYHQVLSTKSFNSGRLFWDVETSETGNWMVGMAYPSIEREGSQAIIGKNNKSWCLCKWNNEYYVLHNKNQTLLHININCQTFRICLDYNAGCLSFHELCKPVRHLHSFKATFTEPLHAAISIWDSAWVKVRNPN